MHLPAESFPFRMLLGPGLGQQTLAVAVEVLASLWSQLYPKNGAKAGRSMLSVLPSPPLGSASITSLHVEHLHFDVAQEQRVVMKCQPSFA